MIALAAAGQGPESNPEPFNLEPPALVPYEALYRVDNNEHASFYLGDKVVLKASHNTAGKLRGFFFFFFLHRLQLT
jgi:hypothetical protein